MTSKYVVMVVLMAVGEYLREIERSERSDEDGKYWCHFFVVNMSDIRK